MRIGWGVDSACDPPPSFFEQESVEILFISVRIDGLVRVDHRDAGATLRYALAYGRVG